MVLFSSGLFWSSSSQIVTKLKFPGGPVGPVLPVNPVAPVYPVAPVKPVLPNNPSSAFFIKIRPLIPSYFLDLYHNSSGASLGITQVQTPEILS